MRNPEPTTNETDEPPVEAYPTPSGHLLLSEESTTDGRWMAAKRPAEVRQ